MDIIQARTFPCPLSLVTFSLLFQSLNNSGDTEQITFPCEQTKSKSNLICPKMGAQGLQILLSESTLDSSLPFLGSLWFFLLFKRTPLYYHLENHWLTTENIHKYNYEGSFLKSEQLQRVSSVLPGAGSSLILGHVSLLIMDMVLEFPLGLNFTQVNPLL